MTTIEEALEDIRQGRMIIVTDDEGRENEGDLIMAACHATQASVNFMAREACGLICVPLAAGRAAELGLDAMTAENSDPHGTAFTVSVDHIKSTTGISAAERARTIQALANPSTGGADLRRPGHVFPLVSRAGGVLSRAGHTEAGVDLAHLARTGGIYSTEGPDARDAAVICEIMNPDGTMARRPQLETFAARFSLGMISVEQLIRWRKNRETLVERVTDTVLPTEWGIFRLTGWRELHTGKEHVSLSMGDIGDGQDILCRVHSECLTGDALGSLRCDCGQQYRAALSCIAQEGRGILVYLRQEGRGIGLLNKLKAYALQDGGLDTVDANLHLGFAADERDYQVGVQILRALGVSSLRLMTNNPSKINALAAYGLTVTGRVPLRIPANDHNRQYLATKAGRMQHELQEEKI